MADTYFLLESGTVVAVEPGKASLTKAGEWNLPEKTSLSKTHQLPAPWVVPSVASQGCSLSPLHRLLSTPVFLNLSPPSRPHSSRLSPVSWQPSSNCCLCQEQPHSPTTCQPMGTGLPPVTPLLPVLNLVSRCPSPALAAPPFSNPNCSSSTQPQFCPKGVGKPMPCPGSPAKPPRAAPSLS